MSSQKVKLHRVLLGNINQFVLGILSLLVDRLRYSISIYGLWFWEIFAIDLPWRHWQPSHSKPAGQSDLRWHSQSLEQTGWCSITLHSCWGPQWLAREQGSTQIELTQDFWAGHSELEAQPISDESTKSKLKKKLIKFDWWIMNKKMLNIHSILVK